jgi:hypothetical protein
VFLSKVTARLNNGLRSKYNIDNIIVSDENYQFHLNHRLLDSAAVNISEVKSWIIDTLKNEPGVFRVFDIKELNNVPLPGRVREMMNNGYYPRRNGDIQIMLHANYIDAWNNTGTTHGLWNPYDAHIPLLWYGWGIKQGKTNRYTYMSDIAPTLAALLHVQMPNGTVGSVIEEVLK